MVFDLTIGGVAKQLKAGSLHISLPMNGRATASFRIDSEDRSYRPAIDAEVIMEEDGVRVFGGLIDRPQERALAGPLRPGISTTVNAVDFNAYTERRFVNETFPEQTLKQRLTSIVDDYLDVYGVSLHGSQVDGPTLPEVSYHYARLDQVLNEQMALTADAGQPFVWRISFSKVIRAYQPSTATAPFDLVGNDLPEVIGDIEVEQSNDGKANKVIVTVTPKTEIGRTETFVGDGSTDTFQLEYTPTKLYGHILVGSGGGETLGIPPDSPIQWSYDSATNSITREIGPPPTGETYSLVFDGVFSGEWSAEDASWATSPREKVITLDSIPSGTTGQAFADAELAKCLTGPTFVRYHTWEQGIEPGQQQTVNVSARNVNETGVITEVVIRDLVHRLDRAVTVVVDDAQTNLGRSWGDLYRQWSGETSGLGGGGSVSVGSAAQLSQSVEDRLWHPLARKFAAIQVEPGGYSGFFIDSAYTENGTRADVYETGFLGRRFTTSTSSGTGSGMSTSSKSFFPTISDWIAHIRIRTGSDVSSVRLWQGFTTIEVPDQDFATLVGRHTVAFRYSTVAGDGGWVGFVQGGVANTFSVTGTVAPIAANTEYLLRIRVSDDGTAIHFSVNGSAEQTLTTNLPSTSELLLTQNQIYTQTAASRYFDYAHTYVEYQGMNRVYAGVVGEAGSLL